MWAVLVFCCENVECKFARSTTDNSSTRLIAPCVAGADDRIVMALCVVQLGVIRLREFPVLPIYWPEKLI